MPVKSATQTRGSCLRCGSVPLCPRRPGERPCGPDPPKGPRKTQAIGASDGLIAEAGREGFEPSVELLTPQPLSRRPQSSTLAPPRDTAGRRNPATPSLYETQSQARQDAWRRERDSNPRRPCGLSGFQDRRNRPLCHPSVPRCGFARAEARTPLPRRGPPRAVNSIRAGLPGLERSEYSREH
jgi:hypothetical protein